MKGEVYKVTINTSKKEQSKLQMRGGNEACSYMYGWK